jgi:hypothetical protein
VQYIRLKTRQQFYKIVVIFVLITKKIFAYSMRGL